MTDDAPMVFDDVRVQRALSVLAHQLTSSRSPISSINVHYPECRFRYPECRFRATSPTCPHGQVGFLKTAASVRIHLKLARPICTRYAYVHENAT